MDAQHVDESVEIDRFRENGGGIETAHLVGRRGGHDDDRDVGDYRDQSLGVAKAPPIHDRHEEIENDRPRFDVLQPFQSMQPIHCDLGIKSFELQRLRHQLTEIRVIIDDEHDRARHGDVPQTQQCRHQLNAGKRWIFVHSNSQALRKNDIAVD